ncbi:MAG: hypothetical protein AAF892_12935 [Cyanobacteria bacterium P01_D01_bin.71]
MKQPVSALAMNGSGIKPPACRNTARVLRISPTTAIAELKKTSSSGTHQPECFSLSSGIATSGGGAA